MFLSRLLSNRPTNAPTMALFHTLPAVPNCISTHPGDLSCTALKLGHLAAPTVQPYPSLSPVAEQSTSVSSFPRCSKPFPQLLRLGTTEESDAMCQLPWLWASAWCSSAWPRFPNTEVADGEVKVRSRSYSLSHWAQKMNQSPSKGCFLFFLHVFFSQHLTCASSLALGAQLHFLEQTR